VAVFSNIILQKRVFDADQLVSFPVLIFGMTVPFFTEKIYRVKRRFFQQNLTFDRLYLLKTEEDHSKRSKVDNLNLQRKRSFINQ